MRQNKFRGWQPELKKWIFGSLVTMPQGGAWILDYKNGFEDRIRVDINTVGQFTGLLDKNGTFIYSGDIITFDGITSGYEVIVGEVKYSEVRLRYEYGKNGIWYNLYNNTMPAPRIIGNIHENPELLNITHEQ